VGSKSANPVGLGARLWFLKFIIGQRNGDPTFFQVKRSEDRPSTKDINMKEKEELEGFLASGSRYEIVLEGQYGQQVFNVPRGMRDQVDNDHTA
jgi:hypothetical protein